VNKTLRAGGQAVIEGIMMIVEGGYALSVRKKDGTIHTISKSYQKLSQRNGFYRLPFIRGIVSFIEMMNLGMDSLNKSAEIYYEEQSSGSFKDTLITILTFIFAFALAILLFMYIPIKLTSFLHIENQLYFNLLAGAVRFLFFIIYLVFISRIKDIKRLFMYHGAEHKTVYAYENGLELTVDNARGFSTKHPRCGTSFIFITLISAILFYAFIDTIIFMWLNVPNTPLHRLINHLVFMPLVVALSYELLTLAGRYYKNPLVKILVFPGILFQFVTTKEPTDDMIEVAIASLNAAFKESNKKDNE